MAITVKFFASLRETTGLSEVILQPEDVVTVTEVWCRTAENTPMPPNTLVAINMNYVDATQSVNDGDEIAFFPPVSGG